MARLENVTNYIEQLKIKSAFFGGFNKEAVYQALKDLSDIYEAYVEELESKLAVSDARLAESRGQTEILNKEISELSKQNAMKEDLINSQKLETEQSKQVVDELNAQIEEIQKERDDERQVQKIKKSEQLEQFKNLKKMKEENVDYMNHIVQMQADYEDAKSQISSQNIQIEHLNEKITFLEDRKLEAEEKIRSLSNEIITMKSEVERVTQLEDRNRKYLGNFYLDCLTKQTSTLKEFFELYKRLGDDLGELNENLTKAENRHAQLKIDEYTGDPIQHSEYEDVEEKKITEKEFIENNIHTLEDEISKIEEEKAQKEKETTEEDIGSISEVAVTAIDEYEAIKK